MAELYNINDPKLKNNGTGISPVPFANNSIIQINDDGGLHTQQIIKDLSQPADLTLFDGNVSIRKIRLQAETIQDRVSRRNKILLADANKEFTETDGFWAKEIKKIQIAQGNEILDGIPEKDRQEFISKQKEMAEYEEELAYALNQLYQSSLQDAWALNRWITYPAMSAIIDSMDVSDIGDVASAARVGFNIATAAYGGASYTAGKALATALKEAAVMNIAQGIAESPIDVLRDMSNGEDTNWTDYIKYSAFNTVGNFVGTGFGHYLGKGFYNLGKYLEDRRVSKLMGIITPEDLTGEVKPTPNFVKSLNEIYDTTKVNVPRSSTLTYPDAVYEAIDNSSGKILKSHELMSENPLNNGIVSRITNDDDVIIEHLKLNGLTKREQAMAYKLGKEKYSDWDEVSDVIRTERATKEFLEEVKYKAQQEAENIFDQKTKVIVNHAIRFSTYTTSNTKASQEATSIAKKLIPRTQQVAIDANYLYAPFREAGNRAIIRMSSLLQTASNGKITNAYELYSALSKTNNVIESLFYGRLKNVDGLEPEIISAFNAYAKEIRGMILKHSDLIFDEADPLYKMADDLNLVDEIFTLRDDLVNINKPDRLFQLADIKSFDRIFDTSAIDGIQIQPELRDKIIKRTQEIITGKKKMSGLNKFLDDALIGGDYFDKDVIIDAVEQMVETNKKRFLFEEELGKALKIQEQLNKKNFRNAFRFFNKQTVLKNLDLVSEKTELARKFYDKFSDVPKAKQPMLQEEIDLFNQYSSPFNAKTEQKYMGFNMGKNNKYYYNTKASTYYNYYKSGGSKTWDKLTPEEKLKAVDKIAGNVQTDFVSKIGRYIKDNFGENVTPEQLLEYYSKKYDLQDIKLIRGNDGFYTKTSKDGIEIHFQELEDDDLMLGAIRHEIEHARESLEIGTSNKKNLIDSPEISSELKSKILAGENPTLDEIAGSYYNNHFFDFQNDSFERSYLQHLAKKEYMQMNDYDRYKMFITALSDTTQAKTVGRLSEMEVLKISDKSTTNVKKMFEDELKTVDKVNQFFESTFKSPDSIIEYIARTSEKTNSSRYLSLSRNLINSKRDEEVGYSLQKVFRELRKENIKNFINKYRITDTKYNDTLATQYYEAVAEKLRNHLRGNDDIPVDNVWNNVISPFLIRSYVGFRPAKDAFATTVSNGFQLMSSGDIKSGIAYMFKDIPKDIYTITKSIGTNGVLIGEDVRNWTGALIARFCHEDYTPRALAYTYDAVKKLNIGNEKYNLFDLKAVKDYISDMALLADNDLEKHPFRRVGARSRNNAMLVLQTDDIQSAIFAYNQTISELGKIYDAMSYDVLSPVGKQIYAFSGYTIEDFPKFKKIFMEQMDKVLEQDLKRGEISSDLYLVRSMIDGGVAQLDSLGLARMNYGSKENNPAMFLATTVINISRNALQRLSNKNIDGLMLTSLDNKTMIKNIGLMTVAGTIGGAGLYGGSLIYEMVKQRKDPITIMQQDTEELLSEDGYGVALAIAEKVLNQTPAYALFDPNRSGGGEVISYGKTLMRTLKKGEMPYFIAQCMFGTMVRKAYDIYGGDEEKTSAFIKSPSFKKQYKNFVQDNLAGYMMDVTNNYTNSFIQDARTSVSMGNMTQQEYNTLVNSTLMGY